MKRFIDSNNRKIEEGFYYDTENDSEVLYVIVSNQGDLEVEKPGSKFILFKDQSHHRKMASRYNLIKDIKAELNKQYLYSLFHKCNEEFIKSKLEKISKEDNK